MSDKALYTVDHSATMLSAAEKIERNKSRAVVVLKEDRVVGVLSEGDIVRALLRDIDVHAPISSFVEHSFKYLNEVDMKEATRLFKKYQFTLIPIVDEEFRLKSVITISQVLDLL